MVFAPRSDSDSRITKKLRCFQNTCPAACDSLVKPKKPTLNSGRYFMFARDLKAQRLSYTRIHLVEVGIKMCQGFAELLKLFGRTVNLQANQLGHFQKLSE